MALFQVKRHLQRSFADAKMKENNEPNLKILATKEDILDVKIKLSESKTGIIRWVFGFFVALLAIVGLYFKHGSVPGFHLISPT